MKISKINKDTLIQAKEIKNEDIEFLYLEVASYPNLQNARRDYATLFLYKDHKTGALKKLFNYEEYDTKFKDKEYDSLFKKKNIELMAILSYLLNKEASYKPGMMD